MQSCMHQKDLICQPPTWVGASIVYQIIPDRFRRSGLVKDQKYLAFQPWGCNPSKQGFHGGDLYGVIDGLDHLQGLGITCIYLTPIFSSAANHRYHTYDYFQVDPILGGNDALFALIDAMHSRGMRIILDGVFNHCSRGFWAFHHLLENGESSPYRDWFHIHSWPLKPYLDHGQDCGYSCWWNDPALPKFNHDHPPVRDYLFRVASYWLEHGIDGWRLDVPDEIPLDFWAEFRIHVKTKYPNVWILGEIWGDARPWLQGEHFDGVMNYRIGWGSLCWVAGKKLSSSFVNPSYPLKPLRGEDFIDLLETTFCWYREEINQSQLNLLDSHDVPRALNTLEGDIEALKLALFILFLQPGAPCIYYGTEAGLLGGEEPNCRECFPWDESWNNDLRCFIHSLACLRKILPLGLLKDMKWEVISEDGLYGCLSHESCANSRYEKSIAVFINRSRRSGLKIPNHLFEPIFLIGEFKSIKMELAPQSAVLFDRNT